MCWGACSVALILSDSVSLWTIADKAPQSMGILQERILDWVAMPSSWGSSQPRNGTQVSMSPAFAGGFFATELLGKPLYIGLEHISLGLKNYVPICSSQYLSVYTYICCSVTKSCLILCQPMDCSMPCLPVPHYLPEFAKVYVHWVGDTIQPSHPAALFSFCFQFFQCSIIYVVIAVVVFSHQVMYSFLWPHGLQHARVPCSSPSSGVCQSSCPLNWWCHRTISSSLLLLFSIFPASGSFPKSQLFASDGQSTGVSASASVLPMNIQDWFPMRLTGLISLMAKGLSSILSSTTVQKYQFFNVLPSFWSNSHICTWLLER